MKYAIKHIPSDRYLFDDSIKADIEGEEDFGSTFLDEDPDLLFKTKEQGEYYLNRFDDYISFESDEVYPKNQFRIVEV